MAKKVRNSIYEQEIKAIPVSDIFYSALEDNFDPDWTFSLRSDWTEQIEKSLRNLDFTDYNYINDYGSYWCGVLTLEPFNTLQYRYTEGEILNLIKDEHFKLVETKQNGVVLQFKNPTKSPLYRFFNQHKEDGCGLNVTYSVNGLANKIQSFLKKEFQNNLSLYGQWIPYEDEQDEEVLA